MGMVVLDWKGFTLKLNAAIAARVDFIQTTWDVNTNTIWQTTYTPKKRCRSDENKHDHLELKINASQALSLMSRQPVLLHPVKQGIPGQA